MPIFPIFAVPSAISPMEVNEQMPSRNPEIQIEGYYEKQK